MKKLVAISIMAAMLLTIAAVAMASETDWLILLRASTTTYTGYGNNCQLGAINSGTSVSADGKDGKDVKGTFGATVASIASYRATWSDVPPLYTTDLVSSITGAGQEKVWDLRLWANPSFGGNNLRLAWWTVSTKAFPTSFGGTPYMAKLEVIDDPTGEHTGWSMEWKDGIAVATSTNPAGYLDWTTAGTKMDAATAIQNGIKLRMTIKEVPEPSSMLALASGLFGMAGFAIRRRK